VLAEPAPRRTSGPPRTRPRSHFLRELTAALAADARAEVELATKVGTLAALHHSRAEIAVITGASPAEVRAAFERLKRVGHKLA
jgi:hypothetical protein